MQQPTHRWACPMVVTAARLRFATTVLLLFDWWTIVRAHLAYVRPLVEFNSIVWSIDTIKDIVALEGVQRRFTKKFPGLYRYCYQDRLRRLQLPSLELRRLHADLVRCYKILFGIVDVQSAKFFEFNMRSSRGHQYKLYIKKLVPWGTDGRLPLSGDFRSLIVE